MNQSRQPPQWATRFLSWFYRSDYLEEIEGDLLEIFEKSLREKGLLFAEFQYCWNVLLAFRWNNLRSFNLNLLDLREDLKIAWRLMRRRKGLSFIKLGGFTIGLVPCILILLFYRYESSFDHFHPHADRTFRVVQHTQYPEQTLYWNTTAYPLASALRQDFPDLQYVTQTAGPVKRSFVVQSEAKQATYEENRVLFVDSSFVQVFAINWLATGTPTLFTKAHDVAISKKIATKYFGASDDFLDVIGQHLTIPGREPLRVVGVFEDARPNQTLQYDLLMSYEFFREGNPYYANNWSGNYQGTTFVVLDKGQHPRSLEAKLTPWKKRYLPPVDDQRISYFLQPLISIHNEPLYGNSPGSYTMPKRVLNLCLFAAVFVLLISVFNFVNLVTAETITRLKEVSIRKVLGGSRALLMRQFITEYALQVVLASCMACLFSYACLSSLNQFFDTIDLQLSLQPRDWINLVGISLITIVMACVYPALKIARYRPVSVLRIKDRPKSSNAFFRKTLVLLQFILVQVFILSAIIASRQIKLFQSADLGFSPDAIISVPIPNAEKIGVFRHHLLQDGNINKVAFGSGPPMNVKGFALGTTYRLPEQPAEMGQEAEMKIGDRNYLDLYQLSLLTGRNFTDNKIAFDEFIVNETLVKAMGWDPAEALGKRIAINEGEATIVGVVGDYHNNSLQNAVSPCIILNWQYFLDHAFLQLDVLSSDNLTKIASIWQEHFSGAVFNYTFVDDDIAQEYHLESSIEAALKILSILVILIACLGIFGLMMFMTQRRRKEVSIRKVLGASIINIIHLFSKEIIGMILLAFCISGPIIYILAETWLNSFAHRITLGPRIFLVGGGVTMLLALLSSSLQIVRAAVTHPVKNLGESE